MSVKKKIKWSLRLPTAAKGMNLGAVPCMDELMVEEQDSPELLEFLSGLQQFVAGMIERLSASEGAAEAVQGELAAAQGEAAAATTVATEAQDKVTTAVQAADALTVERDALLTEVMPLRASALAGVKALASKMSPGVGLDACEDVAAVQRAAVVAKDPTFKDASDGMIAGGWRVLTRGLDSAPVPNTPGTGFMEPAKTKTPNVSRARKLFGRKEVK